MSRMPTNCAQQRRVLLYSGLGMLFVVVWRCWQLALAAPDVFSALCRRRRRLVLGAGGLVVGSDHVGAGLPGLRRAYAGGQSRGRRA